MNYQQEVSTRADVRALYEKVINDPTIACYRGYTDSKSYGWDPAADDYCKREGEVWFPNPSFDELRAAPEEGAAQAVTPCEVDPQTAALTAQCTELRALVDALQAQVSEAEAAAAKAAAERDAALESWEKLRRTLYALYRIAAEGEKTE